MELAREVFDFVEHIDRHESVGATTNACAAIFAQFGADNFNFYGIVRDHASFLDGLLARHRPEEMLGIYVKRRYADIDPVLPFLNNHGAPFFWRDVPYDNENEPQIRELAGLMRDFGLADGLFIPIASVDGVIGHAWFAGEKLDAKGPNKRALHFLAIYAFEHIRRLICPSRDSGPRLSPREKEVMIWTAKGKSAWEIGEILGIAVRTVNEHMSMTRRKLGAANRAQAVALAIRGRHIEL